MVVNSSWRLSVMTRQGTKLTSFFILLMLMQLNYQSSSVKALAFGGGNGRPVVVVPPRAYFLCWKGVCDPRIWDDMVKRTQQPYYSFGLGKRSTSTIIDDNSNDNDDDEYDENRHWNSDIDSDLVDKRARYGFGVGKKDENFQRFRFGLGKRSALDRDGGRRFQFGLGKRDEQDDETEQDQEEFEDNDENAIIKRKSAYNFGLGKRSKMAGYSFGLGKREKPYSFGLGKREIGKREAPEDYSAVKRAIKNSSYSFGLGKRQESHSESESNEEAGRDPDPKRAKFAFGLGKRNSGSHSGVTHSETTVLPENAGKASQSL